METLVFWCCPMVCHQDIVPAIKDAAGCLVYTQKRKVSTLGASNLKLSYIYKKSNVYKLIGVVETLLDSPTQSQSACREVIKYAVVEIHIALYQGKKFFADVVDSIKTIPTLTCERERSIQNMDTVAFKLIIPEKKTTHHRLFQVRLQQLICLAVAKCTGMTETRSEDIAVIIEDCSYFSSHVGVVGTVKLLESNEGYVIIIGRNQDLVSNETWTSITETLETDLHSDFHSHGYSVTSLPGTSDSGSTENNTTNTTGSTCTQTTCTPTINIKKTSMSSLSLCQPIQETNPRKIIIIAIILLLPHLKFISFCRCTINCGRIRPIMKQYNVLYLHCIRCTYILYFEIIKHIRHMSHVFAISKCSICAIYIDLICLTSLLNREMT